jgi:hypothetical protein
MKILYTYKVGKPTFEEVVSKDDDGKEVITKTKVDVPTEIHIKKPSHREIDEMDLFYSIQISELQAKGIATNTMILNNYQDSGGLDSKKEVEAMKKLIQELNFKRNRLFKDMAEKIQNNGLLEEIKELTVELQEYQNKLSSIFERSAESLAERRTILWSILNFIFIKDGDTYKHFVPGNDYKARLENYYDILDSEEEKTFELKVLEKGQIILSSWLRKQAENQEDFALLESIIDESYSDSEGDSKGHIQ